PVWETGSKVGQRVLPRTVGRLLMSAYPVSHMVMKRLPKRHGLWALRPSLLALAVAAGLGTFPSAAQDGILFQPGHMAMTGFPGTMIPGIELGLPPGVDPVDETFIDVEQPSLRVFDASYFGEPPSGQLS